MQPLWTCSDWLVLWLFISNVDLMSLIGLSGLGMHVAVVFACSRLALSLAWLWR